MSFYVRGGIYCGTDFNSLEEGSEENYGPFETYTEAQAVWASKARANIDVCSHRLVVIEE